MGQYHNVVSLNARQHINPHALGAGLKAWEQVAANGVSSALIHLIAVNPGNGAADLAMFQNAGKWAGHRICAVGDYAEDDDGADWPVPYDGTLPLSMIYGACHDEVDDGPFVEPTPEMWDEDHRAEAVNKYLPEMKAAYAAIMAAGGPFNEVGRTCRGAIEWAASGRFVGDRGWKEFVPVKWVSSEGLAGRWVIDYGDLNGKDLTSNKDFYQRSGITDETVNRGPMDVMGSMSASLVLTEGQTRVIANLDTKEFIDPTAWKGTVPTTAGMMQWRWFDDVAAALLATLFEPDVRGGGDLHEGASYWNGRWRGCRLIATSEFGGEFPSTEEVKASFKNISRDAKRALKFLSKV